jgi:WXG100 family type VII secretion target
MASETLKADYEILEQVSSSFLTCAESIETMLASIIGTKDNMMSDSAGDWSQKFDDEMSSVVLPKIRRLHTALVEASSSIREISQELQESEDRAGQLFNQD